MLFVMKYIWCFFSVIGWRHLTFAMGSVATAMLCKEQGITITGICAVYEIFVAQKVKKLHSHTSVYVYQVIGRIVVFLCNIRLIYYKKRGSYNIDH